MNEKTLDMVRQCIKNKNFIAFHPSYFERTERLHAIHMNRLDYNKVRGWIIPEDEDPTDEGFMIIRNMGKDNQHISWMPTDQFRQSCNQIICHEGHEYKVTD